MLAWTRNRYRVDGHNVDGEPGGEEHGEHEAHVGAHRERAPVANRVEVHREHDAEELDGEEHGKERGRLRGPPREGVPAVDVRASTPATGVRSRWATTWPTTGSPSTGSWTSTCA